jgi:uncharacterized protein involved in high-affinity Fe2+ transport
VLAGLSGAALAACGSSAGLASTSTAGTGRAATNAAAAASSMAGMSAASASTNAAKEMSVDGVRPIPTQMLATASWQGMKITARAMTAVPFVIFNGTREEIVKPPKHVSFHLMVMLNDAHTNVPIPYASVWATIRKAGKVVFDERQWPMLSEYMGPHYGNNVVLPGPGHYQLSLLISPPVAARHIEYKNVWLKPHRVNASFSWNPGS